MRPTSVSAHMILLIITALLCTFCLAGCSSEEKATPSAPEAADKTNKSDNGKSDTKDGAAKTDQADKPAGKTPAPKSDDGTVTFTKKSLTPGGVYHKVSDMKMNLALTAKMGEKVLKDGKLASVEHKKEKMEVVEVKEDLVTKAKVTYIEKTETKSEKEMNGEGDPPKVTESPLVGKTYTVIFESDTLIVQDEQGGEVTAEEAKEVKDGLKTFGKPDPFTEAIPSEPMTIGQTLELSDDSLAKLMAGGMDDAKITDATMTLKEVKEINKVKAGIFDVVFVMAFQQQAMKMDIQFKGKLAIALDTSRPIQVDLGGPIIISTAQRDDSKGPPLSFDGKGDMSIVTNTTFDAP
ncbi:MAG: hypothetical protein AAFS10_09020 [Myxococcota bacterium]